MSAPRGSFITRSCSLRQFDLSYYRASGFRALENFLDLAHFPFVHEGLLGDVCQSAIADYHVQSTPDEIMIDNIRLWQPDPDGTGEGSYVTYTYRILHPLTAHNTSVLQSFTPE